MAELTFYEFFAGGGMARAGLGPGWQCLFANDFDHKKAESYRRNWGGGEFRFGDVRNIAPADIPGHADLVWASFPCQDLSLAGGGAGLKGERSGTFWPFWDIVKKLRAEGRHPPLLVLENVCGALTSHGGKDFVVICGALAKGGYEFGALVIDAALFLPQSRPRLFIVAVREDVTAPAALAISDWRVDRRHCEEHSDEAIQDPPHDSGSLRFARDDGHGFIGQGPCEPFHTRALCAAHARLPEKLREKWLWWLLPEPPLRNVTLADLVEEKPKGVVWHSRDDTDALIAKMSHVNLAKVEEVKRVGRRIVGTLYRRTRYDASGERLQRAEARFDDVAGCLRTPAGGSSRQFVVTVERHRVRSRLVSARETARLMGLPDDYILPPNYNEAYHLTGDGVVVPVVRHLAEHILEPALTYFNGVSRTAA